MKLFVTGIFWALGLLLGSFWQIPFYYLLPLLLLPAVLFVFALPRRKPIYYAFYLLALLLGIARLQLQEQAVQENSLSYYHGNKQANIQGLVDSEPLRRGRTSRFELAAVIVRVDGEWKEAAGKALVEAPGNQEYRYGDLIYLEGAILPLSRAGEYYKYLEKQGITSWISFPRIKLIKSDSGPWFRQQIYNLRKKLSDSLSSNLQEPQGALAKALLLGLRQEIPSDIARDFRNTGTTHLLAISGMNISIFAGMVMSLGLWLFGRRHSLHLLFAFSLVWLYAFLAGMDPPVMRAAFMAMAYFLAEFLGRPHSGAPALALAAIVMTAINPHSLQDISFQLSFLAMLGLTFITPLFIRLRENLFPAQAGTSEIPGYLRTIWDMAAVSLGAILATLPLTAYYFNIVPLAGLPATFFASLALPHIIITAAVTSLAGFFFSHLAQISSWISWLFITYMILAVKLFSFWPYFTTSESISFPVIISYYACLVAILYYFTSKRKTGEMLSSLMRKVNIFFQHLSPLALKYRKALLSGLVLANLLIWTAFFSLPDDFTHVYFLDVGQGDSVFIQTPRGHQILIDGGPDPYKTRLYLGKIMPFWDRSLDMVVLTHPHQDHLGGLGQVLIKYDVDYVLDSYLPIKSSSYEKWREQVRTEGAKDVLARDGLTVNLGNNTSLEILHPSTELDDKAATKIDDNAMVLRLTVGKVNFLFPSDNRNEGQRETLFSHPDIQSSVLAAPHHGGDALDPLFIKAASPSSIVVSASFKDSTFRERALSKLRSRFPQSSIFTTSERGTIEFITDGKKLWVRTAI